VDKKLIHAFAFSSFWLEIYEQKMQTFSNLRLKKLAGFFRKHLSGQSREAVLSFENPQKKQKTKLPRLSFES
jgi:hypothetical protein